MKQKRVKKTNVVKFSPRTRGSDGEGSTATADGHVMLDVNTLLTGNREGCLALVVTGDSERADIYPGYVVVIDPNLQPKNGDTVAAEIDGETCVTIFEQATRGLHLVPKNKEYPIREAQPINALHVLGVVRGHVAVYERLTEVTQ
jgi:SOS-response transcriptional repressor LexA